jgi:non-ribosomal peptide synthetase component F
VLVEYRTASVTVAQVSTLRNSWQVLLERALEVPATPLGELPLLTTDMREQLDRWSGSAQARPGFKESLPDLVERWARETPGNVAARDARGRVVTYGEVWAVSSHVARALQMRGIHRGDRVSCTVERCADTPALLLGILRAGAAYVTPGFADSFASGGEAGPAVDLLVVPNVSGSSVKAGAAVGAAMRGSPGTRIALA